MIMQSNVFINPIKPWSPISGLNDDTVRQEPAAIFKDVFDNVVNEVYSSHQDVENKQYLLATGQLDDAHSLPIAEAKAALSLEVMISLRNKAMESYQELLKMNI